MTAARLRLSVFAVWLLASAILVVIARDHIAALSMWDPDDYLRLQQVRDLLGGQSFFDVSQYRIDPPNGVPMHWSRIVDLPIAALILTLRPILGVMLAERVAISAVPLLIFGGSLAALTMIGSRIADRRTALITAMLAAAAPLMLFHIMPLRIDHHGWQTMLGLFTIAACFDPRPRRGGMIAGAAAALWLAISLEALPMVAAIAALLAIRFVADARFRRNDEEGRFQTFAAALATSGMALFILFHGPAAYQRNYCDAVSPAWFGPMILTPSLAALLVPLASRYGMAMRVALVAAAGVAGLALLAVTAPACLHGPFAALDPVVRFYWYDNVLEGLPVWKQPIDNRVLLVGFPPVGLLGTLLAWRSAATRRAAHDWLTMLALLLAAFALSLLVQRAGAFAHGCALPGAAFLLTRLLDAIGRWRHVLLRVAASACAIMALSPVGAVLIGTVALSGIDRGNSGATAPTARPTPCARFDALARLPRSYMLTGLDLTPRLLVMTPHSFAGSSHHRDPQAIRRVIDAFIGSPEAARRMMVQHGMDYVLIDPDGNEAMIYSRAAPQGLMSDLLKARAPAWLQPVALEGSRLRLWRRTPG
ncbi:hypothetical protein [Rhizorhabdus argentea]|uniref:hypothetical protein n=1 Tax=Rhizorhabdus argentea TaxID=1387174 RepID=UPI0030EED3EC